jgi:8-oxo-dGTP pyrophosphatase MutT (NUDIX family)
MDEFGPWKRRTLSQRYDNPWIRVEHHEVVTPRGHDGVYGVVHFKNYAIGVIPLDDQQNTWIVGQYRYPHRTYTWEIPEGGGPVGQNPLLSAQRELAEEVGLSARRWDLILEMDLSNSVTDERCLVYVARELEPCSSHPDETEELQVQRISFADLHEGVLQGRFTDSITIAGVLKLQRLLERGQL